MSEVRNKSKKKDFVGIYKPNRTNSGSCAQFKLGSERDCMFLEVSKQIGPQLFDWKNSIIRVKLGVADISKLLALFNCVLPIQDGDKPELEIFHKSPGGGNKSIKFKVQERGYYMKVFMQGSGGSRAVAVPIGWDEAELLKIALSKGYEIILGW